MANYNSDPVIQFCLFDSNWADYSGGGMRNKGGDPVITNCIFWANVADDGGGQQQVKHYGGYNADISYTNIDSGGYDVNGNIRQDPLFADPGSGDFQLQNNSPCVDTGSNSAPSLSATDLEGDDRIMDGNGYGSAIVDMGAYDGTLSFANNDSDEDPYTFTITGTVDDVPIIPSVNEWGMILLIGILMIASVITMKRKQSR